MSTYNPLRKHTSTLFASRGCDFDEGLQDAFEIINRMPTEQQSHAMTAVMIVVNTAANAVDQVLDSRSPEKLAILQLIRSEIDNWASSHLDNHIETWVDSNLDVKDIVREYLEDNLDVDHSIEEWMKEYLESHISEAIENIDLVVRVR